MRSAQGRGPTLDEAVDAALIELGESRRDVDVRVLSEGPEETVVEVTVGTPEAGERLPTAASRDAAPTAAADGDPQGELARSRLEDLLTKMGIRATVAVRSTDGPVQLDVTGRDLGLLIGWRGETLRALQAVANMLVARELGERRVIVDVERYRQRREHTVREIAYRAARQVKMTGDPITLDAMQPFERRAIHLALEDDPSVLTNSIGEEPNRRVVVSPRSEAS
jgi:spoIIIJ-associated protein